MRIERHGALSVVRRADSKDEVQKALRTLDERLFLEQQIDFEGRAVWCVVVEVRNEPPIAILEWRDPNGDPIADPSMHIYERVAAMERDGAELARSVIEENRALLERRRAETRQTTQEILDDMLPRMSGMRSAVLPRGQHLRRSRDKRRARGEKI